MTDFVFDVRTPPLDVHFVSLIDPQTSFAASGNDEWKEQQMHKLAWQVVDLPDSLFASSAAAETVRRAVRVFQGALQYGMFVQQKMLSTVSQLQGKIAEVRDERSDLFDELVELREVTAYMQAKAREKVGRGADASSRANASGKLTKSSPFECYICGNVYPSSGPLQSHFRKRHGVSEELATHAAQRCSALDFQATIARNPAALVAHPLTSTTVELEAIRGDVSCVKQSISDLVRADADIQRELERSRDAIAFSMSHFQQLLVAQHAVSALPAPTAATPPPPQQIQVVLPPTAYPPAADLAASTSSLELIRYQQKQIDALERTLAALRDETKETYRAMAESRRLDLLQPQSLAPTHSTSGGSGLRAAHYAAPPSGGKHFQPTTQIGGGAAPNTLQTVSLRKSDDAPPLAPLPVKDEGQQRGGSSSVHSRSTSSSQERRDEFPVVKKGPSPPAPSPPLSFAVTPAPASACSTAAPNDNRSSQPAERSVTVVTNTEALDVGLQGATSSTTATTVTVPPPSVPNPSATPPVHEAALPPRSSSESSSDSASESSDNESNRLPVNGSGVAPEQSASATARPESNAPTAVEKTKKKKASLWSRLLAKVNNEQ